MNGKRVILATAGVAFAAGVIILHAQEQAAPAAAAQPLPDPYLVLDAPTIPYGNSSHPADENLQERLNEAAAKGYRVVGVNQNWIIMEHLTAMPESKARRRVVLPTGD